MRTEDNDNSDVRWLDTALKQYGKAEPRPGLENRILSNLHAERARQSLRPWWWRPAAAVVAAAVFAAAWLLPRRNPEVTGKAATPRQATISIENKGPQRPAGSTVMTRTAPRSPVRSRIRRQIAQPFSVPHLDQFPAPSALSEQEEMLVRYVREHRLEATMVARARSELLKQELEQFMPSPSDRPTDLEQ